MLLDFFSDVRESLRITMLDLFMNSEEKEFRDNVLNEHYSFLERFLQKNYGFSSNSTFDYRVSSDNHNFKVELTFVKEDYLLSFLFEHKAHIVLLDSKGNREVHIRGVKHLTSKNMYKAMKFIEEVE